MITGGAGMVGSHAAEFYASGGAEVVILDNLMRSRLFGMDKKSVEYNWEYLGTLKGITRIKGDIRNADDVAEAIGSGVDALIHCAAQPGVGFSIMDPREDFSINALGTFTVLEAMRTISPKAAFVYCSTNKVYGEHVSQLPLIEEKMRYRFAEIDGITEEMPIDGTGHTPYGVSKYAGELYAQEYSYSYGMKCGIFRMSCTYGTRQFGFEDQGWIAHFIISAVLGRPVTIYGDGKQLRDILYVGDLVRAFDIFIKGPLRHGVFNIGGGRELTLSLLELIGLLKEKTGRTLSYSLADWRPSDQKVYVSNLTKVRTALGWEPAISVSDGIDRLIEWVEKNKKIL